MFRTQFASIIRSIINCSSNHWCLSWVRDGINPVQESMAGLYYVIPRLDGFEGLVVRALRNFRAKKILSTPSFGGEIKPSVTCRKFTACKRTQNWRGSRHIRQNSRLFLAHSSTFRCWSSLASFQTWGTPGGGSCNVLITGPPGWGVWRAAGNGSL